MPVDHFLGSIWGRARYHGRSGFPDRFADLLLDEELDQIFAALRPQQTMLRLVRQGEHLPFDELLLTDGGIDMVQLRKHYADGYTIVLNGAERFAPKLRRLTNAIAVDMDFEAQINAYVTPPETRGFTPHFDAHHVLVIQVRGTKLWSVYEQAPLVAPEHFRQREHAFDLATLGEPERIELIPGDILYLPRGRVHAAEAGASATLHLTIGFHPPTLLALLIASLEALSHADGALLDILPPRFLRDPLRRAALMNDALKLAGALASDDVAGGLATLEDRLIRTGRCPPTGAFIGARDATGLSQHSRLERSLPLMARIVHLGDTIGLQFAQALVVADPDHRSAFEFLLSNTGPFQVADLPLLSPGSQLALAEKLMEDGFLRHSSVEL
jgi:bifunctional lysine-specific demethylase and histidyl-hydroxylase NO66